ncbi:MAG TPA: hypothetical protein VM328_10775 [Fimbriimonadaceae bacterium]|nr:hypothetical protein [Fimbriimonadaceae bacterium]
MFKKWPKTFSVDPESGSRAAKWLLAILLVVVLAIFTWGSHQELTPELLRTRLRVGMSRDGVCEALHVQIPSVCGLARERERAPLLAAPGIGRLITPQYQVSLEFDGRDRLVNIYVEVHYQWNEAALRLF